MLSKLSEVENRDLKTMREIEKEFITPQRVFGLYSLKGGFFHGLYNYNVI